ncbi:MAG: 1-(5-phosphoribosyl)-5-[(5-phosphoribosylamino)methylideneamino]imidazole-4-carboxamide isomerase [Sumerlaeia bacterium]
MADFYANPNFEIIPAIDLYDGEVVRLKRGERDQKTVYSKDPVGFALRFQEAGARRLHVVDLNGAFDGRMKNLKAVSEIASETDLRIELGGGIRTRADAEDVWSNGVHDVILGTRAAEDREFVQGLLRDHGARVIVGIDAKDGKVATHGWVETTQEDALDFARSLAADGCQRIIFTDVATDGMLTGPNYPAMQAMARAVPGVQVVASGGVSSLDDILALAALEEPNLAGVITGRALYDGRLDLAQAVQTLRS